MEHESSNALTDIVDAFQSRDTCYWWHGPDDEFVAIKPIDMSRQSSLDHWRVVIGLRVDHREHLPNRITNHARGSELADHLLSLLADHAAEVVEVPSHARSICLHRVMGGDDGVYRAYYRGTLKEKTHKPWSTKRYAY